MTITSPFDLNHDDSTRATLAHGRVPHPRPPHHRPHRPGRTNGPLDSQADASAGIPTQWRAFLADNPTLVASATFYGASPCAGDHKIHYLSGVLQQAAEPILSGDRLTLEAGEYAVVTVTDTTQLRDTWGWLLGTWLPASGRRERNAPEFERFTAISEEGAPIGPVELWIPLEPSSS